MTPSEFDARLARQLAVIDADLGAGRLKRAREYVDRLAGAQGAALDLLRSALAACEAQHAGAPAAQSVVGFARVAASTLPFPGAQLAAGRYWLAQGELARGLGCLARAKLCGLNIAPALAQAARSPGAAPELLRGAAQTERGLHLGYAAALKRELLATLPATEALAACAAMLAPLGTPQPLALPLAGLRDHARASGSHYREWTAAAKQQLPPPRIVGRADAPPFEAHGRTLFTAALADATLTARSCLVQSGGKLLFDFQDGELDAMPPDFGCDGLAFGRVGNTMAALRFAPPALQLDEAFSLLGPASRDFGHWIGEFLPRLFLIEREGAARAAPLLVDVGMPASHREALDWFNAGRRQVIELAEGASVHVVRLWVAATSAYAPYVPAPGTAIRVEWLCSQADALAALIAAQRVPDPPAGAPQRLFLARGQSLRRPLVDQDAIESLCAAQGFTTLHLETLPFVEQLRLVRGASQVVGPAGSALLLAMLYGAPGQRMLVLHPPALDETASLTSAAAARGVDVQVLLGEAGVAADSFSVEAGAVTAVLAYW